MADDRVHQSRRRDGDIYSVPRWDEDGATESACGTSRVGPHRLHRVRGPPTHIKLLRDLCVTRQQWLSPVEFEDAVAACNLLPGPASTQLAIFCAWRVRGAIGALVGGAGFVIPGLLLILGLAAVFLSHPPTPVLAAGAGAGSAVAAIAIHTGAALIPASWRRAGNDMRGSQIRWSMYIVAGIAA